MDDGGGTKPLLFKGFTFLPHFSSTFRHISPHFATFRTNRMGLNGSHIAFAQLKGLGTDVLCSLFREDDHAPQTHLRSSQTTCPTAGVS